MKGVTSTSEVPKPTSFIISKYEVYGENPIANPTANRLYIWNRFYLPMKAVIH